MRDEILQIVSGCAAVMLLWASVAVARGGAKPSPARPAPVAAVGPQPNSLNRGVSPKLPVLTSPIRPAFLGTANSVGGRISPTLVQVALDTAATTVKFNVANGTGQDENYTLKASPLERTDVTSSQTVNLRATLQPSEVLVKAGDSQPIQLTVQNPGQVHAGTYRTVVSVLGSDGVERSRSTVVGTLAPAVTLVAVEPDLDAGSIKRGSISVIGQFVVDSNTSKVQVQVSATDLYLNDDAASTAIQPIPLDISAGVLGNSQGGSLSARKIPWHLTGQSKIGDTTATSTDPFLLSEPGTAGNGIRDVLFFTFAWRQDDLTKPAGAYGGRVRVTVLVLPDN